MYSNVKRMPLVRMKQSVKNACSAVRYKMASRRVGMIHKNRLYTQAMFRTMLVLERKRTERTKCPFLLVRVAVDKLTSREEREAFVAAFAQKMESSVRETDLMGWISGGREMGVVITEINTDAAASVTNKIRHIVKTLLTGEQCQKVSVSALLFPDHPVIDTGSGCALNAILYGGNNRSTLMTLGKRTIDVAVSIGCIFLFLPVFLIVPLLIKMYSKGPVFFIQNRIGRYGKLFPCLKFRTMDCDNDSTAHEKFMKKFIEGSVAASCGNDEPVYKIKDDPRVTRIGKFLRKTSLDELPQFVNVLLGHMSIVGPRPAISYEVEAYDLWHRRRVLEVKPGITGVWQVEGRSRTDFNSMVRMDIRYINSWSPILDLQLIISTPLALVTTKGAC